MDVSRARGVGIVPTFPWVAETTVLTVRIPFAPPLNSLILKYNLSLGVSIISSRSFRGLRATARLKPYTETPRVRVLYATEVRYLSGSKFEYDSTMHLSVMHLRRSGICRRCRRRRRQPEPRHTGVRQAQLWRSNAVAPCDKFDWLEKINSRANVRIRSIVRVLSVSSACLPRGWPAH